MNRKKYFVLIICLTCLLIFLGVIGLLSGSKWLGLSTALTAISGKGENGVVIVMQQIRLPRVLTSVIGGAGLGIAGLLMQTYFRNGLAGPYILGIGAGSGFGVAVLLMASGLLGLNLEQLGVSIPLAAVLGALGVLLLLLTMASRVGSGIMLLIVGIMLGSFVSAGISIMQYFTDVDSLQKYVIWTMGSTTGTTLREVNTLCLVFIIGLLISCLNLKRLNALLLGEEYAVSMGIPLQKTRRSVIIATALLAGGVTAYCGPIAFIGLAVPHLVRMLIKSSDHMIMLPFTAIIGAITLLFCDIIAQLPGSDLQLPVNAITSLIGAPLIITVILKKKIGRG